MPAAKHVIWTLAAAALLALAACSPLAEAGSPNTHAPPPTQAPAPAASDLANSHWKLVSFGANGAETPVLPSTGLSLSFDDKGQASGQGGCNSFGGDYKVENHAVSFTKLAQTLRACADDKANQQEQAYMHALQASGRYEITGDRLTLQYDNGAGVLNFVRAAA